MKKRIALRPYLESIEGHCRNLTREELVDLILNLAKEVPSGERIEFIDRISELSGKGVRVSESEDILQKIEALKEDIEERINAIENGSYYDEHPPQYSEWDRYGEEEPDFVSDEQKEELGAFFEEASDLFLSGRLEGAGKVYSALLDLVGIPRVAPELPSAPPVANGDLDDYDTVESTISGHDFTYFDFGIDLREAWARYCRCVYETTRPQGRLKAMLAALSPYTAINTRRFDIDERNVPMLRDVVNAKTGDLPEWDRFLPAWKDALAGMESPRANLLLLEAAELLEGLSGVERLVRRKGPGQPLGYLYWVHRLEAEGDRPGTAAACGEALSVLPAGTLRAQAAEKLTAAGGAAGREDWILQGKREAFFSLPDEPRLLVLLEEARKQDARARELAGALDHLLRQEKENREGGDRTLLIKALLMAGRLGEAFERGSRSRAVGWSYGGGDASVLFAAVLAALVRDRLDEANTIRTVIRRYMDQSRKEYPGYEEEPNGGGGNLRASEEVLRGLADTPISGEERKTWLAWALSIGRERVDQIVSSKHRNAYRRAAEMLAALAECLRLLGRGEEGRRLIEEYRDQKYPRHSAFRGEVNAVIGGSRLLR